MPPSALQMRVIKLKSEEEVRDLVLYFHEAIAHEPADPVEYGVPPKFSNIEDDEIRGMLRALRWVIENDDEDLL